MTEGTEVLVERSFADLVMNQHDVGKPVTVLEIVERRGQLPLIQFVTASGQILHLFEDAFHISSYWRQWMEDILPPSLESGEVSAEAT